MDQLLKEFELLSLPSRVNLEDLSDSSIDRLVESINIDRIFDALKEKGPRATAFQWRKLREACLIKKGTEYNSKLINSVYEESVKFAILKKEMSECHIALSKLLDLSKSEISIEFFKITILFRYFYSGEGLASTNELLRANCTTLEKVSQINTILNVCIHADAGNILKIKSIQKHESFSIYENVLIDSIIDARKVVCFNHIVRAYPLITIRWFKKVLCDESTGSAESFQNFIFENFGVKLDLNESMDKFVLKKRLVNK